MRTCSCFIMAISGAWCSRLDLISVILAIHIHHQRERINEEDLVFKFKRFDIKGSVNKNIHIYSNKSESI